MEGSSATITLVLEWLTWVLFFFAWAILVKTALRRLKKKNPTQEIKDRKAYYFAMIFGILMLIFILLFGVDPFISFLVNEEMLEAENGPYVFWGLATLLFFVIPFVVARLGRLVFRMRV
ncbi:MAG: hypothetical protein IPJ26_15445 [Bacteroidetes bacterium]|jgi:polyferredoxin|nr:hypothetical protein [Bacteroidota bacterium]